MGESMSQIDERCWVMKKAEVSDNMQILRGLPRMAVQADSTHGRLSMCSPTMCSWIHSSSIWVKMILMDLTAVVIMMDGKH